MSLHQLLQSSCPLLISVFLENGTGHDMRRVGKEVGVTTDDGTRNAGDRG